MLRRCVAILVIAGFLASQLAVFPHSHAGMSAAEQSQYDATPHLHGEWFLPASHDHSHGHDHSHSGHSHAGLPDDRSDGQPAGWHLARLDHDSDVLFVPETAAAATVKEKPTTASDVAVEIAIPAGLLFLRANAHSPPRWRPPDQVLDASDTYLTLRNLRI